MVHSIASSSLRLSQRNQLRYRTGLASTFAHVRDQLKALYTCVGLLAVEMDPQEVYAGMVDAAGILEDLAKDMLEAGLAKDELKTEADPLELIRADLAIQLEDDVAEPAESEAIRSSVRQGLHEVKQLSCLSIWKQRSDTLSQNLDHL